MARGLPQAPRWAWVVIGLGLVACVVLAVITNAQVRANDPDTTEPSAARTDDPTAEPTTPPTPTLVLPGEGASVLFLGDSYTEGYGVRPLTGGYAYLTSAAFGWEGDVRGIGGTGYTVPGDSGQTMSDRIRELPPAPAPDLVILEAGLNDYTANSPLVNVAAAGGQAITLAQAKYPDTTVVLLGPVNPYDRSTPLGLANLDTALRAICSQLGVPYISPISEGWEISRYTQNQTNHPDAEGYAYMADQLEVSLKALAGGA